MNRFTLIRQAAQARQDILALLPRFDVLSVDFFDTLATRDEPNPVDLLLGLNPAPGALDARRRAEYGARQAALLAGRQEVLLAEIHAGDEAAARDELAAEEATLAPDPHILAIMQEARRRGLRIAITSDTYLPMSLFRGFCARHHVPQDTILLSCAHGRSKEEGGLFEALKDWAGPQARVLHIGDNIASDVHSALNAGVLGRFLPSLRQMTAMDALPPLHGFDAAERTALRRFLADSAARVEAAAAVDRSPGRAEALAAYLGQLVLGPLWLGFGHWLRQEIARQGIDRLHFLARDGHCLQRAFQLMFPRDGSSYLHLSRSALYLPAAAEGGDAYFEKLIQNYSGLTGMQMLRRLRLSDEAIYAATNEDERNLLRRRPPLKPEAMEGLKAVFAKLRSLIEARGAEEAAGLARYLAAEGLSTAAHAGIVDLGWHNSLQVCLGGILDRLGSPTRLTGFYMGTFAHAQPPRPGDGSRGFLFDRGRPRGRLDAVRPAITLLELLHAAPHGSTLAIDPGSARPVLADSPAELADHERVIAPCQEEALAFICRAQAELGPLLDRLPPILADLSAAHMRGLFAEPGLPEARTLGGLRVSSDFGVLGPMRALAAPLPALPEGSLWPPATRMLEAYRGDGAATARTLFRFDAAAHDGLSCLAAPQRATAMPGVVIGFSGPRDQVRLEATDGALRVAFDHEGPWRWRDVKFILGSSALLESPELLVSFRLAASQATRVSVTIRDFVAFDYEQGYSDTEWKDFEIDAEPRDHKAVFHLHPRVIGEELRERHLLLALPLKGEVELIVHEVAVTAV
jgi:HAD superfamily hydrolase (TIGR01549 family)